MYRTALRLTTAVLGLAALTATTAGGALADGYGRGEQHACYATKEYGYTRLVLDVKFHSALPVTKWGGKQAAWDVAGKHSFVDDAKNNIMATVDGTVVTSGGTPYQSSGAHMGLTGLWVRGAPSPAPQGGPSQPQFWDCTSAETSATPGTWACTLLDEGKPLTATLYKLQYPDQYCDVFQDTKVYPYKAAQ
jgi:hypothetical protein